MEKITIITVTFNCKNSIEKTIQNIINQSYKNIEYIIVDGRSTDGTVEIINKYRNNIDIFISEPDNGIYDGMNKGIKLSSGDWIIFMNSGDYFVSLDILDKIFKTTIDSNIGVIHGGWFLKYKDILREKKSFPFYKSHKSFRGMGFSHQSVFVRSNLAKNRLFNLSFKLAADYDMIWNLYYKDKTKFYELNYPISIMEEEDGATIQNYKKHIEEVCQICGFNKKKYYKIFVIYSTMIYKIKRKIKHWLYSK